LKTYIYLAFTRLEGNYGRNRHDGLVVSLSRGCDVGRLLRSSGRLELHSATYPEVQVRSRAGAFDARSLPDLVATVTASNSRHEHLTVAPLTQSRAANQRFSRNPNPTDAAAI